MIQNYKLPQANSDLIRKEEDEVAGFSIDRKALYNEIWASSVTKVAEKHGISYNRLLSACKENNIPIPPSGYNTKREFGKPVQPIPLPEAENVVIVIEAPPEKKKDKQEQIAPVSVEYFAEKTIDIVDNNEAAQTDEEPEDNKVPLQRYVDQQQTYREELYQKVWERPVSEVAKDYSISDNALRKRCLNLDIPLPERGYWAKLKAGKTVHKEKLPKLTTNFPRPHTGEKRKLHIETDALSFMERKGRLEIFELASVLRVGGISSKMLDAAQKMADDFKEWHKPVRDTYSPGGYWIPGRRTMSEPPFLANDISTKTASRAFHILDAIDRALKPYLGSLTYQYTQNSDKQYVFSVNGEKIPFSISEGKDKIIHEITQAERLEQIKYEEARSKGHYASKPNIPKYEHPWNGKLKISVAGIYDFVDCKAYVLEDRIGEILIAFFEASYSARLRRLQEEEKRRKEHEEYLRKERIKALYNNEVDKTNALLNKTADFEIACRIRRYIDAIKNNSSNPDNNPEWIDWANKKADWIDPTVAREDEFFGKRKHGQDVDQKELKRRW